MKTKKTQSNENSDLRSQAKEQLKQGRSDSVGSKDVTDEKRLLHELQVHQLELEMQNEELSRAKLEAENALAKYSDLYEFAPIGLFTVDTFGQILEANLTGAALLGMERHLLLKKRFEQFVAPGDRPSLEHLCQQAFRTGVKQSCELKLITSEGSEVYVRIEGTVTNDSLLNDRTFRLAVVDITARKRAEKALSEREAKYRLLAENTADVIWILDVDSMRFTYVSPSVERLRGYTPEEVRAQSFDEFLTPSSAATIRALLAKRVPAFLDGDQSAVTQTRNVEIPRKDGSIVWAEAVTTLFKSGEGTVKILGATRDITERKRREEQIEKLTQIYLILSQVNEAIVRTHDEEILLSEVCGTVAKEGNFPLVWIGKVKGLQVVPVAWSGPAADYLKEIKVEMEGELSKGPTGTCIREDRPVINEDFLTNHATSPWREPAKHYGFRASAAFPLHRQGKAIGAFTLYSFDPGAFDEEQVGLLESLSSDISYALDAIDQEKLRARAEQALTKSRDELEQRVQERTVELTHTKEELELMNEQLQVELEQHQKLEADLMEAKDAAEEAVEAKAAFLANMSHELRTPMNAVIGFTSLLLDEPLTSEQKDCIEGIRDGGQALLGLINDILDFSKADKEKVKLEHQPFSLKNCIESSLDIVASQANQKGLSLSYTINYGTPDTILGDPGRLRQILVNLLGNAVKFTDEGDVSVFVSSKSAKGSMREILFTVKDTGIGIPPEKLDKIFEPFTQVERVISRKRDGVGLGLAISKKLVELMGGKIWAESLPGRGTTLQFTIEAEIIPGGYQDLGAVDEAAFPESFAEQNPLSILVAEDNPSNQRVLVEMLRRIGYRPDVAADGKEVLQALERRPYDLILMDVRMPEMDGITATKEIRKLWPENGPKIVAITAYALEGDRQMCLEAGMDDHIGKPIQKKDLQNLLKNVYRLRNGLPGASAS